MNPQSFVSPTLVYVNNCGCWVLWGYLSRDTMPRPAPGRRRRHQPRAELLRPTGGSGCAALRGFADVNRRWRNIHPSRSPSMGIGRHFGLPPLLNCNFQTYGTRPPNTRSNNMCYRLRHCVAFYTSCRLCNWNYS